MSDGIYSTDQVGKLPSILDEITLLEMPQTPLTSALRVASKPDNIQSLYFARDLRAVKRKGRLEGKDVDTFVKRVRKEIYARGQYFGGDETSFKVSDQAKNNKLAGGITEYDLQRTEALLELKRQMESQFLSNDDSAAEAGTTPNTTRGVFKWGSTTAQGHLPVDASLRPVAAQSIETGVLSNSTWNEAIFLEMMRTIFDQTNKEADLMGICGSKFLTAMQEWVAFKKDVSGKTLMLSLTANAAGASIFPVVDFLECIHGKVKLKSSAELLKDEDGVATTATSASAVFLDPDLWEIAYYEDVKTLEFEDRGGGKRGAHFAAAQLRCLHPRGQGYIRLTES